MPSYSYDPYLFKLHRIKGGTIKNFEEKQYQTLTDDQLRRHFDDFTIDHKGLNIIETTDYYPFGLVMNQSHKDHERDVRYGYQGQFAEEDKETGWNHFEAREYDPVIGRWLVPDPAREFASPYVGMGNKPVSVTDPDGRCTDLEGGCNFFQRLWYGVTGRQGVIDFYDDYQSHIGSVDKVIQIDGLSAMHGVDESGNEFYSSYITGDIDLEAVGEIIDGFLPSPFPIDFILPDEFGGYSSPTVAFKGGSPIPYKKKWVKEKIWLKIPKHSKIMQKQLKEIMSMPNFARAKGEKGIKYISDGIDVGGTLFHYEIKFSPKSQFGNHRIYGNLVNWKGNKVLYFSNWQQSH